LHAECRAEDRDPATIAVSVHGLAADAVDPALVAAYDALGVTDLGVRLPLGDERMAVSALRDLATRCAEYVQPADAP